MEVDGFVDVPSSLPAVGEAGHSSVAVAAAQESLVYRKHLSCVLCVDVMLTMFICLTCMVGGCWASRRPEKEVSFGRTP